MKKNDVHDLVCYEERFQKQEQVNSYETHVYGNGSYSYFIWQIQQPVLRTILNNFRLRVGRPVRLLDFACGTGRITSFVENFADVTVGVDISPAMVEVARSKAVKTKFIVGDILSDCDLLQPSYDVITSFRFLLNAPADMRRRVLQRLREVIQKPDGLLIVNVHGNSHSIRHPVIAWKRWRLARGKIGNELELMLHEMSPAEAKQLLSETGFEIIEQIGFGVMPGVLYRTPLRGIASVIDQFAIGKSWCKNWSIDLLFVCRPKI